MKIVYLAGPYTGHSPKNHRENIREAEEMAYRVAREVNGWWPICVHGMAREWYGFIPESKALDGDFELVRRSNAVLLVGQWYRSQGTLREIEVAKESGVPVYDSLEALKVGFPTPHDDLLRYAEKQEEIPF